MNEKPPPRSDRAKELLYAAEALQGEARLNFLREHCGSDDSLRAEVERLLAKRGDLPTLSAISDAPPVPQQVSHYRIVGQLGHGGMGIVYRAVDDRLNRTVAIKVLPPERSTDAGRRQRIIREAQTASSLNHPNIVTIHEIEQVGAASYIVMEYVSGQTLADRMRQGPFELQQALSLAVQVADAVAAAHAAGIMHRDLKPANIMVTEAGIVKLLDFGLAKLLEPAGAAGLAPLALTADGAVVGTPFYMSPEQAEGRKVDARSDIFAFGVVLYEMLTGRHPFASESITGILDAITEKDAVPPSRLVDGLPPEIDAIVAGCLRKDPDERPQRMSEVQAALRAFITEPAQTRLSHPRTAPGRKSRKAAAGLLLAAILGAAGWLWFGRVRTEKAPPSVMIRLTTDPGLTTFPAFSADGKLVAYTSDRGAGQNLDLWVQQLGGGDPVRVCCDEADETEPSFSPDGLKIAFRSDQRGGGIYVVPALGGDPQLIAPGGRRPRFSPDGARVLYWTGEPGAGFIAGSARLFTVPASGGEAVPLRPEFAASAHPLWLPDGKRVLFLGRQSGHLPAPETVDWWVAPIEGGEAVRTGALSLLRDRGLSPPADARFHVPEAVTADGRHVLFSARQGDATNVWQAAISPAGKVEGDPIRLTSGTGDDRYPAAGRDGIVFSSQSVEVNVWSLRLRSDSGKPAGPPEQVTNRVPFEGYPSVSADGARMTFVSARSGNWDVWLREVGTGKERALTRTPARESQPKISADGSRVAWWQHDAEQGAIYVVETGGGVPEKVCEPCGPPTHLSADGRKLLFETFGRMPLALFLLDLDTRKQAALIQAREPRDSIPYAGRFSPDGRWIAFHRSMRTSGLRRVFVAPLKNDGSRVQESDWIPITDEGRHLEAYWSPNGRLVYFLSDRDGFRCIWAQPLDPVTKHPAGSAFAVEHFHNAVRSIAGVGGRAGAIGLSAVRDRLIFSLGDVKGNLWYLTAESRK